MAVGKANGDPADLTIGGAKASGSVPGGTTFDPKRLESPAMPTISFFRNRWYDAETQRWTQEDPLGVAGGINLYQYVGGNPVAFSDPFGLAACPKVEVDKKRIKISVKLNITGGSLADQRNIRNGILNLWSGKKGGFNIVLDLDAPGAPSIDVTIQGGGIGGQVSGVGGSRGRGLGGVIEMSVGRRDVTEHLAAHEFGHAIGLDDSRNSFALMYHENPGLAIFEEDIITLIKKCGPIEPPPPDSGSGDGPRENLE